MGIKSKRGSEKRLAIGFFIADIDNYTQVIWDGILDRVRGEGINTLLFQGEILHNDPETAITRNLIYQLANEENLDGLIILTSMMGSFISHQELVNFCRQFEPLPIVSVGEQIPGASNLLIDNKKGLHDLLMHLFNDHDCHRVAFIKGPERNNEARQRYQVYRDILAKNGIPFDENLVVSGRFHYDAGVEAVNTLLNRGVTFDAIAAADDALAWGAMDALLLRNIDVPQDVAVVGFDDADISSYTLPPLSTVRQPWRKIGMQAVDMLLSLLDGKPPQEVTLETRVVLRQSCGCASPVKTHLRPAVSLSIQKNEDEIDSRLTDHQDVIRESLNQALDDLWGVDNTELKEKAVRCLDALFDEITLNRSGEFLNVFQAMLRQFAIRDDLDTLRSMLSEIWAQVIHYCPTGSLVVQKMDVLWQQAETLLRDVFQQIHVRYKLQSQRQTQILFEINEDVITSFDLDRLNESLVDALHYLEISCCYLCLHDEQEVTAHPGKLPSRARLIFAYQDEALDLTPDTPCFSTEQVLPENVLPNGRHDLLLLPLWIQCNYLGYAVLEMGPRAGFFYNVLRLQISSAIHSSLLVQRLNQSQTELEQRVEARTAELQREIRERRRVEATLRENEKRYRALFEQTTDAVFIVSLDGTNLVVNQRTADLLGYTVEEMIGMPADRIIAPGEFDNAMEKLNRVKYGEVIPVYERTLMRKDGRKVPVEVSIALVRDDEGNPSHVQSIVRDISKRKQTDQILQMFNQASLSMRTALTPGEIFEAAGQELKTFGFNCAVLGVDDGLNELTALYHNYDSNFVSALLKRLGLAPRILTIKVGEVKTFRRVIWEQETVFVSLTDELLQQPMPTSLRVILELLNIPVAILAPVVVNNQVMGMLAVQSRDLTEENVPLITAFALQMAAAWHKARLLHDLEQNLADLQQTEESLRESEEKYRSLFDLSPEAILLIGLNGIILDANQAAARFWEIDKQEIIGRSFLDIGSLAEGQPQYFLDFFAGAISGDIREHQEMQFVLGEDEQRWAEVYPTLLKKEDETLALQIIIRDVTERKAAEQAIQRRLAELESIYLLSVQLVSASLRVSEITEIAVRQLINIMHVDRCTFSLYDAKTDELKTVASMWFEGETPIFTPDMGTIQINDYPATKHVLETMRPQVFQVSDPKVSSAERTCMQDNGTATLVVVPLAVQDQAIGILKLETHTERQYTTSELNLAITLGNLAAVALANARLYETAQQELQDRIQAETALQKSEERFRSIFENAVMGLYRSTPDGKVLMANPALIRMLGYENIEQLAAFDVTSELYLDAADRELFISLIEKQGQVINLETAWKKKDGSILYVRENSKAIRDDAGRTMYYEGTIEDITERKVIEQERQTLIEFQRVVTELSARFINLATDEIEAAIGQAMSVVAKYTGADAASVWIFDIKSQTGSKVFGWPTNEKRATNQNVPFERYPWIFEKIIRGESVTLPGWEDAPIPETEAFLSSYGMHAILAVPLVHESNVLGALSVYTREREKSWTNDLETLLKIVGDIIVNALERKQAEESIRKLNDELEQRVIQRTQQLEAANQELEAFAYSVSHDLRAPLRAIDGFSLALVEDYKGQLDDGAISYLDRVRAASQRMGELIDDLLKLSRITRSEMVHHLVNLSALVEEITTELQDSDPDRDVTFHIQPGISAQGDQQLLRVMLTNLLNNAWKFTSKKEQAIIEFGCLDNDAGIPVHFVRDNGAGFNMDYADKLFGTFQRLHSRYEFEGTGIGLATVKRIVLRHGGRIWAEGEVGHGATFYFTLGEFT